MEKIRPGVIEVSLTVKMEIDPRLQEGNERMVSARSTHYVHFRKGQILPKMEDAIAVGSINRFHYFTGRSFNWSKSWIFLSEKNPTVGRVEYAAT